MILYQRGGKPQFHPEDPEGIFYHRFNTELNPLEESFFQMGLTENDNWGLGTYDSRGFWKNREVVDERGHGTDKYKKPNHPTFSNQSMYHSEEYPGGVWSEGHYTPSEYTRSLYSPDRILLHLKDDPVKLIYGKDTIGNYHRKPKLQLKKW